MFHDTDAAKSFHSAAMHCDVLAERSAQIELKHQVRCCHQQILSRRRFPLAASIDIWASVLFFATTGAHPWRCRCSMLTRMCHHLCTTCPRQIGKSLTQCACCKLVRTCACAHCCQLSSHTCSLPHMCMQSWSVPAALPLCSFLDGQTAIRSDSEAHGSGTPSLSVSCRNTGGSLAESAGRGI